MLLSPLLAAASTSAAVRTRFTTHVPPWPRGQRPTHLGRSGPRTRYRT
jgi:hypothetical protein